MDDIIKNFQVDGEFIGKKVIENGLINNTYVYSMLFNGKEKRYIIQKINKFVFPHPDEVMQNILNVTQYLKKQNCITLNVVLAKNGLPYFKTEEDEYCRCYDFIENTFVIDEVKSEEEAFNAGKAFGEFLFLLKDYPADSLFESIKDFHNTKNRYDLLLESLEKDVCNRKKDVEDILDEIEEKSKYAFKIINEYKNYSIPHRVTHNDTKINNVLFDKDTKKACVIDLDTIMPGTMLFDVGDAIVTSAVTKDNKLDLNYFESYFKGYFSKCKSVLTKREIELIPLSVKTITFELVIRFLKDYLDGDIYFKISYENENEKRARNVLSFLRDIEEKEQDMVKIINSI